MACKFSKCTRNIETPDAEADFRNTLIESLSQQKAQGEDIVEIRENIRAQRAEQALSLLSRSLRFLKHLSAGHRLMRLLDR